MKNTAGTRLLRKFKAKYNLTWPEVAKSLGVSLTWVQDMYSNKQYKVAHYYVYMLKDFIERPEKIEEYKNFKHKDL